MKHRRGEKVYRVETADRTGKLRVESGVVVGVGEGNNREVRVKNRVKIWSNPLSLNEVERFLLKANADMREAYNIDIAAHERAIRSLVDERDRETDEVRRIIDALKEEAHG